MFCNKEYSRTVIKLHENICEKQEVNMPKAEKPAIELSRKELLKLAKENGISNFQKTKSDDLIERLKEKGVL